MKKLIVTAACGALVWSGCSMTRANQDRPLANGVAVAETSDSNFKVDVLSSNQPVLVDFYATWCGPCRLMSPVVDDIAQQYTGKLKVFKVDIDRSPILAQTLGIEAIPTLAIFKNGALVSQSTGLLGKSELKAMIDQSLQSQKFVGTRPETHTQ